MMLTLNHKNASINTIGKAPVLTGKTTRTHKTHIWTSIKNECHVFSPILV